MTAGPIALSHKNMGGLKVTNMADGTVSNDSASKGQVDTAYTNAISRTNHTSTQTASTISDFDAQVRTSRLDQFVAPTGSVAFGSQRIVSVADPSGAQDAATKSYVDLQLSAQASGLVLKGSVRAAVDAVVTVATPGATLDGLTAAPNDLFWLRNQSTGSQNGPFVWNGAAVPLTRPLNFDTSSEAVLGSFWDVREGTYADTFILMTNDSVVTLGVTTLTSVIRGAVAAATGFTTTCPAVAAGASWVVTHNLNTKFILEPAVARVASPFDFVVVRSERTSLNTVTILPDVALASGEYEVMIVKAA